MNDILKTKKINEVYSGVNVWENDKYSVAYFIICDIVDNIFSKIYIFFLYLKFSIIYI